MVTTLLDFLLDSHSWGVALLWIIRLLCLAAMAALVWKTWPSYSSGPTWAIMIVIWFVAGFGLYKVYGWFADEINPPSSPPTVRHAPCGSPYHEYGRC